MALLNVQRSAVIARTVLSKCETAITEAPTEADRIQLLRVMQFALLHGKLSARDVPQLGLTLLASYPSQYHAENRELVRLLTYLQQLGAAEKFAGQLTASLPFSEKLPLGACAAGLETGWERESKLTFMQFHEASRARSGGYSLSAYLEKFARNFFTKLALEERQIVLARGLQLPNSALSVLAKLPADAGAALLQELRALDGRVKPLCKESNAYRRLRVGIVAGLGRSGEEESLRYLRKIYRDEPAQRNTVAMALTQHPGGQNWPLLIDSLKTVDGPVAREVLLALTKVAERPSKPEAYHQVILLGLRLDAEGALQLLNHWSGQELNATNEIWQDQLTAWQQWYGKNFPTAPPASLPIDAGQDKWSYEELLSYLEKNISKASADSGRQAFATTQCVKCHRCGHSGETTGPDLSTVTRRFQRKEILESIVYPTHNISDRYISRNVISNGRTLTGLVIPRGEEGVTVMLTSGEKVELQHAGIEAIQPSSQSPMPSGLLNSLTLQQVADLFAYLEQDHTANMDQKEGAPTR